MGTFLRVASAVCVLAVPMFLSPGAQALTPAPRVLILGPSAANGTSSWEAQEAAADGFGVDVVSASQWDSMTTAQFASYRAIIIADDNDSGDNADVSAAESDASTWGAAVNGNIILAGADPEFHATNGASGAQSYIRDAIAFAAANPGRTGFYYAGTYYGGTNSHMIALDGLVPNGFYNSGVNDDTIHIDPGARPIVPGPTDASMSGWHETAHHYFTTWPSSFHVWAIGTGGQVGSVRAVAPAGTYTTTDGQTGYPHFLVSERIPPVSTISGAGCTTSGTVTFTLTDNSRGSGPKAIHYRLDGGSPQTLSTTGDPGVAKLTVPTGRHTLQFWGEDRDGNLEAPHTVTVTADDAAGPKLKITSNQHTRVYTVGQNASVKITATDDLGLKHDPSRSHEHLDTSTAGHFKLTATATDVCGHRTTKKFHYRVKPKPKPKVGPEEAGSEPHGDDPPGMPAEPAEPF